MHVAQLLDALFRSAHIEVVETLLPDRAGLHAAVVKQFGELLFHNFHHHGRVSHFRLGYQEVEVLGHYHVADYDEAILLPGALQDTQKQVTALAAVKLWAAPVTTAGYEVQVVATIPALQTSRHALKVSGADNARL
jgi:hypothetical protein